jgi:ribosomal protein S4
VNERHVGSRALFQLVHHAGAAASGRDARRKIEQGGVRLGGERVVDPRRVIAPGRYELEVGKKFRVWLVVG